jgi:hypothetical protein
MKALVIACLALQAIFLTAAPPDRAPPQPKSCPFGHTELKRVPILYGLLAMDADLQKRIDNLEVWPGGCILGEEKEKLVCKKCSYHFEPLFGYWSKQTHEPKLLQLKADPFIADWSVGKNETTGGRFYQHVRNKAVCGEEFYCWYKLSEAETEALVRKHLARFDFKFEREERNSVGRHYIYYRAFQKPHYYLVEIMNDPGQKEIHVHAARSVEKPLDY